MRNFLLLIILMLIIGEASYAQQQETITLSSRAIVARALQHCKLRAYLYNNMEMPVSHYMDRNLKPECTFIHLLPMEKKLIPNG